MEWQPIETAPKSGDLLVYCRDTKEQFVAFWSKSIETDDVAWTYARFRDEEGMVNSVICRPSHWMPLPEPPNTKKARHPIKGSGPSYGQGSPNRAT